MLTFVALSSDELNYVEEDQTFLNASAKTHLRSFLLRQRRGLCEIRKEQRTQG